MPTNLFHELNSIFGYPSFFSCVACVCSFVSHFRPNQQLSRSFFPGREPPDIFRPQPAKLCNEKHPSFNMYIKPIALLSLLGAAHALAPPKILAPDDVIVPNDDGSYSVMKDFEYGIQKAKREIVTKRAKHSPPTSPREVGALERRCDETTEVQVLSDTNFNNWDVAMSPVISNTGSSIATIAVTKGYSIGNSISVRSTETVSAALSKHTS